MKHYKIYRRVTDVEQFGVDAETPEEALRIYHASDPNLEKSYCDGSDPPHHIWEPESDTGWDSDDEGKTWKSFDPGAPSKTFSYDESGDEHELRVAQADTKAQAEKP